MLDAILVALAAPFLFCCAWLSVYLILKASEGE